MRSARTPNGGGRARRAGQRSGSLPPGDEPPSNQSASDQPASDQPASDHPPRGRPRPVLIALDGRSGAGKTTAALELAALLRQYRSVSLFHLDDIYPGWDGLERGMAAYRRTVLEPLHDGRAATWVPWAWDQDAGGPARTTEPADVVLLEGVGAAHAAARPLLDAVVWMRAEDADRQQRALGRDGDLYAPYWDQWAAQESAWLAVDQPHVAADVVVDGGTGYAAAAQVLGALAELPALAQELAPERAQQEQLSISVRRVDEAPDPELLFARLYGNSPRAVWLDSSDAAVPAPADRNRFSIMADDGGPLGQEVRHTSGVTEIRNGTVTSRIHGPFFRWLESAWSPRTLQSPPSYPAQFSLGWLGYLGYELKRETGGSHRESPLPDAGLIFAGRGLVYDHAEGCIYLLTAQHRDAGTGLDPWAADTARLIRDLAGSAASRTGHHSASSGEDPNGSSAGCCNASSAGAEDAGAAPPAPPVFSVRNERDSYMQLIERAQSHIAEGDSYEVCLTTRLHTDQPITAAPYETYLRLRRASPAPFAAFVRLGPLTIASTSPERFLRIDPAGRMQAEPIKGTRPRADDSQTDAEVRAELAASSKDRAENIMIVDLLRNDLSHFAVSGSVTVARLCEVESYASVHQLVSTIEARLRPGAGRAAAVAAAFPPGSMTGAPKISTMAILDELEQEPRGVYSGVLGYFSLNGAADLSVVIRTLVMQEAGDRLPAAAHLSIGVGGAITADSDPQAEWNEVQVKARGILSALGASFPGAAADTTNTGSGAPPSYPGQTKLKA